jgi:hypothetical protein
MSAKLEKVDIMPPRDDGANVPALQVVTPMTLLDRALSSGASIEMVTKLMDLQDRYKASQALEAFNEAMASAKAEIPTITKNREVDFTSAKGRTHYRYEDLGEIAKIVNPILAKHGLSYRYRTTSNVNEPVTVTCIVSHRDGHFEENTLCAGRDDSGNKNSIQQVGSTLTYLQRMTLKAALGLAVSNDDDGKSADAGDSITLEQVEELVALADEVGADKEAFCRYFKVDGFAHIPVKDFPRAVAALNKKRAAK